MQFHPKGALLVLLLCAAGFPAVGQQKVVTDTYRATRELSAPPKPLTPDEGLAILNAALDSRHQAGFTSDCSHFVHGLYQRAGFPYEYASSTDLYTGVDEFRRVTKPQAGDLAVWRGHTGIVVDPSQHSFFSLLSAGPGVDTYDSPYWRHRGRPRFFRYIKASSRSLSGSLRTASLNPTVLNPDKDRESDDSNSNDVREDEREDSREAASSEAAYSTKLAANRITTAEIPRVALVHSVHPKPEQVNAAFLQVCADSEDTLRAQDLFKSPQPVIVFDHFEVSDMHTSGNQGWVDVQIDEVLFFVDGKAETRRGRERQRWLLTRRDKTSWELTAPRGTIYVPQHIAVRIMSHQLAQLTEERPNATARPQQKAELARVLESLLRE